MHSAALEAAGRDDVMLVSFDLDPVSFELVKEGKILGLVVQDPFLMGYEGVNAMVTKLQGGNRSSAWTSRPASSPRTMPTSSPTTHR